MASKKLMWLIVLVILSPSCIPLVSCSRIEPSVESEAGMDSFDLNSAAALQAADRLSEECQQVLGTWQLSIEDGNHSFYEIPDQIFLLPYADPPSPRPKYFVLKPELPKGHVFQGDTYWTLNERGELILWWIKYSGIRATLHAVNEDQWEGVIEEVWDFQKESVQKSVVVKRL